MCAAATSAPFSYAIDVERGLVFLVYGIEQPTGDEWCAVMDDLRADPLFRTPMHLVSDRRRLMRAPTTQTIEQMSAYVGRHRADFGRCRWAIVTREDALAEYGMVRKARVHFEAAGSEIDLRPFHDMEQAIRWATTGEDEP